MLCASVLSSWHALTYNNPPFIKDLKAREISNFLKVLNVIHKAETLSPFDLKPKLKKDLVYFYLLELSTIITYYLVYKDFRF